MLIKEPVYDSLYFRLSDGTEILADRNNSITDGFIAAQWQVVK
ncbi:hypothetical protein [Shewanella benthica]|nr:hypothetical protein [Shewanella benthica]